ncbi:VWA domain-containing protein [Halochromatium salexigens]|uniref:VWA domain-containing protein n=1 Tax=Halochromatium salexigens TaxID=49447 RepID=A0AAJ0UHG1_HALSE|nr:VWA domain-containing protein [Halochromatium salexigens]MBK5931386.1 VWA domain-containing protein [Halochromatium salexigens]
MNAFEFAWPWFGLLLPLPFVLPWLWPRPPSAANETERQDDAQRTTLLHPQLVALEHAYRARRPGPDLASGLGRVLLYLLWAALVVALMRPQWLVPHTEVSTPGYDVMLAVDASHSMDALDFSDRGQQVNRMQVVKSVMGRFIDERAGDRVGLIIFGTEAFVLSPLTIDRHAVQHVLAGVVPSIAGGSTALGDAIALGVKKLRQRPEGSRVMILIADGDNTAGSFQPLEAAGLARLEGIRIYVIGVGSKQARIPILHQGKIEYWDDLTMDEDTLRQIADLTGGAYFRATNTSALQEISQRIGELEKTESETRTVFLPEPLYRWPLALGLLALLVLGLFPEGRRRVLRRTTHA